MRFFLEDPVWLWTLAAIVPFAWIGLLLFQAMAPIRRWVSIAIRVLLTLALAALLAGAAMMRETNRLAVVAVVDVSGSVERFYQPVRSGADIGGMSAKDARDAAKRFLQATLSDRGIEDLAGLVVFDGQATVASLPGHGRVWEQELIGTGSDGTNIAEALRIAAAIIPPDAAGRVMLFTDGNQTRGDALAAVRDVRSIAGRERRGGLPIDVVPFSYRLKEEVLVEAVDAPPTAPAESTINLRVVLWATQTTQGTLQLLREGSAIDLNGNQPGLGRRVSLSPGRNVVQLEVELGPGRVHRFKALFEPDAKTTFTNQELAGTAPRAVFVGDQVLDNNQGESFTISPGKGSVLLIDGVSNAMENGAGITLAQTLRRAGVDVSVVSPDAAPTQILTLQAYDMVIFENVSVDAIDPAAQEAYVAFVRDLGGGLVMIGGPDSFGAGGWKGTPIATILPVDVELPDRVVAPEVATVFVLDNSGSMKRPVLGSRLSQQQIANDAVALAIGSLDRNDLVGVVTFNSSADTLVPLTPNSEAKQTIETVRDIRSGGGTDMAAGLERAIRLFEGVQVKTKQCVVLTDGKSMRDDELVGLTEKIKKMGVKVSTIAVGDDADTQMLDQVARTGGGTYYHAVNPRSLPKIFLKAVKVVRSPLIREGEFEPAVLASGSAMVSGIRQTPTLGGLVLTRLKKDPTVVQSMISSKGEPLLVSWQVGLGQVVAFTSDAHKWASNWISWPGYERMWVQIVRAASRPPDGRGVQASASASGDDLAVRVEVRNEDGTPATGLTVPATLYEPSGHSREISLTATGPGVYEANVRATETGSYVALVKPSAGSQKLTPAIVGTTLQEGVEFRTLASNDSLIASIAKEGGGRVLDISRPRDVDAFNRRGIKPAEAIISLWTLLMTTALTLFLFDVASRRVAWDRFVSKRFKLPGMERADDVGAAGARQVSSLRARIESSEDTRRAAPSLALSEQDAAALAEAARDRRRAARLAAASAGPSASSDSPAAVPARPSVPATEKTQTAGNGKSMKEQNAARQQDGKGSVQQSDAGEKEQASGLLAAKKRAARRFDE